MSLGCTSCIRSKSGQAACAIALAQGQQCLHRSDESAAERLRRQAAVKFVDDVNIAQARRQRATGKYASLVDMRQGAAAPLGFVSPDTLRRRARSERPISGEGRQQ